MKEKETNHFDGNDLRGVHIRGCKKQQDNQHPHMNVEQNNTNEIEMNNNKLPI